MFREIGILYLKLINLKKYFFEGIIIFCSVFLSLYLNNLNNELIEEKQKKEYLIDLKNSVDIDILQIESLINTLLESEKLINNLQDDIDKRHTLLSDIESIQMIIEVEVGFSFFPKDGIFNQMISTGAFELISSNDLKTNLLEMFNHQKARNYATSVEIDNFNIQYRKGPFSNFRIRFDYNLMAGEFYGKRKLVKFQFNNDYYFSDEFYGLLSQAKLYSNMYRRQLNDFLKTYNKTKTLIKFELDESD